MPRKLPKWMEDRGIEPHPQSAIKPTDTLGDGPGTVLLELNKRDYGVPPCSDCNATARMMNDGGPEWCREHLEELVDEIQPRVQRWLELGEVGDEKVTEPTWAMKLSARFPEAAQRKVIRARIRKACKLYEQRMRDAPAAPPEPQGFDGLPAPPVDIDPPRNAAERSAYKVWHKAWGAS